MSAKRTYRLSKKGKPRKMKTTSRHVMKAWEEAEQVPGMNPDLYRRTPAGVIVYIRAYKKPAVGRAWTVGRNGKIVALTTIRARKASRKGTSAS